MTLDLVLQLKKQISQLKPRTLAGLAVHARMLKALEPFRSWETAEDLEDDQKRMIDFLDLMIECRGSQSVAKRSYRIKPLVFGGL